MATPTATLLWRAPTQLRLPAVRQLPDGPDLVTPTIRGRRRERLLAAARAGADLSDINALSPSSFATQSPRSSAV